MHWRTIWRPYGLLPATPAEPEPKGEEEIRLFPIVDGEACYAVTILLARGLLEEAGWLVPDGAWIASAPLYG